MAPSAHRSTKAPRRIPHRGPWRRPRWWTRGLVRAASAAWSGFERAALALAGGRAQTRVENGLVRAPDAAAVAGAISAAEGQQRGEDRRVDGGGAPPAVVDAGSAESAGAQNIQANVREPAREAADAGEALREDAAGVGEDGEAVAPNRPQRAEPYQPQRAEPHERAPLRSIQNVATNRNKTSAAVAAVRRAHAKSTTNPSASRNNIARTSSGSALDGVSTTARRASSSGKRPRADEADAASALVPVQRHDGQRQERRIVASPGEVRVKKRRRLAVRSEGGSGKVEDNNPLDGSSGRYNVVGCVEEVVGLARKRGQRHPGKDERAGEAEPETAQGGEAETARGGEAEDFNFSHSLDESLEDDEAGLAAVDALPADVPSAFVGDVPEADAGEAGEDVAFEGINESSSTGDDFTTPVPGGAASAGESEEGRKAGCNVLEGNGSNDRGNVSIDGNGSNSNSTGDLFGSIAKHSTSRNGASTAMVSSNRNNAGAMREITSQTLGAGNGSKDSNSATGEVLDVLSDEVLDVSHDTATASGDVATGAGRGNGSNDGGNFDSFGSDNAISTDGSGTAPTDSDGFDRQKELVGLLDGADVRELEKPDARDVDETEGIVAVGEDGAGEDAALGGGPFGMRAPPSSDNDGSIDGNGSGCNTSITSSNTCNGASTATEDIVAAGGSGSGGTTSTNADSFDADAPIFRSVAEMKDVCGDKMEALNELNRQHSQAKDAKKKRTRAQTRRRKDAGEDLLPQIVATQRSLVNLVANYEGQTDPSLFRDGQIDLEHRYSRRVFKQKKRRLEPKSSNHQQSKQKRQTGRKKVQATGSRRSKRVRGNEGATIDLEKENSRVVEPVAKKSPSRSRKTPPEDIEPLGVGDAVSAYYLYSCGKKGDWIDATITNVNTHSENGAEWATYDVEYNDGYTDDHMPDSKIRRCPPPEDNNGKEADSDGEEESSGGESDYEDASTKRRAQPKKRSKSKPKAAKQKRREDSDESEAESDAESDCEDASTEKGTAKKRPVTDAEYDKFKHELANRCRKHQKDGKWKGKVSKHVPDGLRKACPPELRESILNALLEKHNLTDMSEGWKTRLWNKASTIARDGKKVNGDGAGDVSSTYEQTKRAETKAKQCTDDGTAALYDEFDGGKNAALRFVEESKQSECKRAELEEKLSKLQRTRKRRRKKMSAAERTKEATERAELAVEALDSMEDVQSEDEATADILDAMKNAHVRIHDAGEMCKTSARDMMPAYEKSLRSNPTFAELDVDARENGVRMVKSQICHQQVSVRTLVKLKRKGLAHIPVMKDENGQPYKAIFVAAPEWLILHYCQGTAKQHNGGAGNTKNRAPVETGGHLQVDILNGGLTINTNAAHGERGHLDNETKRIFQVVAVDKCRRGTIDTYAVNMPITHTTLQVHQLVLGTAYFYGMNSNLECHTREGGILAGVVGAGETVEEQFRCDVTCPKLDSLIEQGLVKDQSLRCDGDHLFGRSTVYMNGIWWVQPVSHRENGTRSWVREKWGEWLIPLCIGAYTGGNSTPASSKKRI